MCSARASRDVPRKFLTFAVRKYVPDRRKIIVIVHAIVDRGMCRSFDIRTYSEIGNSEMLLRALVFNCDSNQPFQVLLIYNYGTIDAMASG
jgi:hypothetical protein